MTDRERTALFLLPTDVMGGAENVLRMTAGAALASGEFGRVVVFTLAGRPSGTLDGLAAEGAEIVHSGARSERTGLAALARVFARRRYALVVSSHTHLNAAASAARAIGLLRTDRLVARESTMAFERDLGRTGPLVRGMYRLYGAQDRIVCQTERMAEFARPAHSHGRLRRRHPARSQPRRLRTGAAVRERAAREHRLVRPPCAGEVARARPPYARRPAQAR